MLRLLLPKKSLEEPLKESGQVLVGEWFLDENAPECLTTRGEIKILKRMMMMTTKVGTKIVGKEMEREGCHVSKEERTEEKQKEQEYE